MRSIFRRWLGSSSVAAPVATRHRFRPALQSLDDRIVPAVTFATEQAYATGGSSIQEMAVGDFNTDGRPDLVTANNSQSTVSVLLNAAQAGSPTNFYSPVSIAVTSGPTSVAVGDLDGDGRVDLVTVSRYYGTSTLTVLRNTTATTSTIPSFTSGQTFTITNNTFQVRIADINGDGRNDILALTGGNVTIRLNTTLRGATTFTFAAGVVIPNSGGDSLAVGDLDGDGRPDLATAGSGTARVLLNTTPVGWLSPEFGDPGTFIVGGGTNEIKIGDFNGDGRADLVTSNTSGTVSVLRNTMPAGTDTPSFAAAQNFAAGTSPNSVTVADLNGDGRPDLATANSSYGNSTGVVLENTTANGAQSVTFTPASISAYGSGPFSIVSADFNGDGRPDLAAVSSTNASVKRNTTTGFIVTGPTLVGQFGNTGLFRFNRVTNSWVSLGANADAFAVAPNGNIVANLGANGVWYYRPTTGWTKINSVPALAVAIDGLGNVYASFGGIGVGLYRLDSAAWGLITPTVADKLVASANGDVVANFNDYGLYRFRGTTGWVPLSSPRATALAIGENGDIAANLGAYGVYRFKAGTWSLINSHPANALAVGADGAVAATFTGYGVAKYIPYANGWASLTGGGAPTSVAMDLYGNVYSAITGYGTYEFDPYFGWRLRRANDASIVAVG